VEKNPLLKKWSKSAAKSTFKKVEQKCSKIVYILFKKVHKNIFAPLFLKSGKEYFCSTFFKKVEKVEKVEKLFKDDL